MTENEPDGMLAYALACLPFRPREGRSPRDLRGIRLEVVSFQDSAWLTFTPSWLYMRWHSMQRLNFPSDPGTVAGGNSHQLMPQSGHWMDISSAVVSGSLTVRLPVCAARSPQFLQLALQRHQPAWRRRVGAQGQHEPHRLLRQCSALGLPLTPAVLALQGGRRPC